MTFKVRPMIEIRKQAVASGMMSTLLGDAVRKVLDGTSSIAEVLKAVQAEA
jgi:hypothetical protein